MSKNWQHEPFYWAPTPRLGGGWIAYKDSPSPPPAPNYAAAAQAQGQANIDAARLTGRMSNPNIYTPYGSQTVSWGNGTPQFNQQAYQDAVTQWAKGQGWQIGGYGGEDGTTPWYTEGSNTPMPTIEQFTTSGQSDQPTVTQTLAPEQQRLLNSQNQISQNLADIGTSELPRLAAGLARPLDTQSAKDAVAKAYGDITSRLDPQWQQAGAQKETALRNQGLVPGTEAYDAAMRDFNQGKNDAYTQANLAAMGYAPTTMQMDITGRDQLLNELNALRSGSQVQNPQFQPFSGSNVSAAPIFGAAQAQGTANQNAYNAQVGQNNAFNSGLFQLGGAALMAPTGTFPGMISGLAAFSDRRLKSNIERIGTHPIGIGIYEYDIFGKREIGVMADELESVMPDAVIVHPSGFKMVDYGRL